MKNLLNKIWKKEEGFTLIELIIVIAILAIIAAIAIPNVISAVDSSRQTTDISNAKMIADAAATVRAQNESLSGFAETMNVADTTGASNAGQFADAIRAQLNGVAPTPKYKGGAASAVTNFVIDVAGDGTIEVYSVAGSATTTSAALKLFPTPASVYTD